MYIFTHPRPRLFKMPARHVGTPRAAIHWAYWASANFLGGLRFELLWSPDAGGTKESKSGKGKVGIGHLFMLVAIRNGSYFVPNCRKGQPPRLPLSGHLNCFLFTHPRPLKWQLTQRVKVIFPRPHSKSDSNPDHPISRQVLRSSDRVESFETIRHCQESEWRNGRWV